MSPAVSNQTSNSKKLLTHSLGYLLIGFLPLASNFVIAPIFTRYLSYQEYGLLALAAVAQSVLAVFIDVGFSGSFSRYYFKYYTKQALSDAVLSTSLASILLMGVVVALCSLLFGDWLLGTLFTNSPEFGMQPFGWIAFATALLVTFQGVLLSLFRNSEKIKTYVALAGLSFITMTLGAVIGVVYLKMGALGSLWGKLVGIVLVLLPFLVYQLGKGRLVFRKLLFIELLRYGLPILPYALLGIVVDQLDKVLIERWLGTSQLGLYNVGFLIASIPNILIHAGQSTINPTVYKVLENEPAGTPKLSPYFTGFLLFILLVLTSMIGIGEPLIDWFLGADYYEIVNLIPILLLAFFFRGLYVIYASSIFFKKKTKYLPWINLSGLITGLVSGCFLIDNLGIIGVCWMVVSIKLAQLVMLLALIVYDADLRIIGFRLPKIWLIYMLVFIAWILLIGFEVTPSSIFWWLPFIVLIILMVGLYQEHFKLIRNWL